MSADLPSPHTRSRFLRSRSGSIAVIVAIVVPALVMLIGGAIDLTRLVDVRLSLQAAVDAAALAAAKEVSLSRSGRENYATIAEQIAKLNIAEDAENIEGGEPTITADFDADAMEVAVAARLDVVPAFGLMSVLLPNTVHVRSVARVVGSPNICLLALEPDEARAVDLQLLSRMTANGCSIFSNSTAAAGISVFPTAKLEADNICSAGGVLGADKISPSPVLDCPQFDDPLASRPEPSGGACDYDGTIVAAGFRRLRPGVYCGGLTIAGLADVALDPGVYTITGGPLLVTGLARLRGDDVTLHLADIAVMTLDPTTTIELAAARAGPTAGILVFGSRAQPRALAHTILSRNAQRFVGTVYLPRNSLVVDGDARVGGTSAYTAIVARRVMLLATPHVVLNADYARTDIPVPEGIRGVAQPIRLTE
ncbi:MAG: pilus assembly protein TadG-related protein [Hyphomicrobium sp.]|nr:pilus assembly protein TadG-related protein [Hyphomicrobium sp.]